MIPKKINKVKFFVSYLTINNNIIYNEFNYEIDAKAKN